VHSVGPASAHGLGLLAWPSRGSGPGHGDVVRALGALAVGSLRVVRAHDGVVAAGRRRCGGCRRQGVASKHKWGPVVAPDNVVVDGFHSKGSATVGGGPGQRRLR
jgi:hypothetical protein